MNEPLVSVIVPTYNREGWLPLTLESLQKQTYQNWEAIIQNDAGRDVAAFVRGFGDKRMKYDSNPKNVGLAATRNNAMARANGDYICWLDDDDIYLPMALEFRMWKMKQLNADVVYTRALQNIYRKVGNQYQIVHRQLYWDCDFDYDKILVMNIAPCLCPLFSRKAWEKTGFYLLDETMTSSEDQDFWVALSRHNYFHELKLVDSECSYREDKTQMTGSIDFSKNWVKTYKRWRHTAKNLKWVTETQNNVLRNAGIRPEDFGL
jgi:glycosyltransferase involved in cell wall biosynthesis